MKHCSWKNGEIYIMRFKGYVNEDGAEDLQEALDYMGVHCSKFLKDAMRGGRFMWSGRKNRHSNWFVGDVRKGRRPVDSSNQLHDKMDDMFLKKFGFRARSNVLFCTGSHNTTSYYGNTYSIWPIGDYKFVWSPSVRDIVVELENMEDEWESGYPLTSTEEEKDVRETGRLEDLMRKYTDKDIKAAIKSGNEIMLHCKKYVALNFGLSNRLLNQLKARK